MKQYKKKVKKKKKNHISDEIVPTKHDKIGNINFYSEEVAKEIIEKLISLTISSNFKNKVEKQFNDFCLDEFLKKINNLIQIYHIDHETDDFNCSDNILSKIKYQKTDENKKRYKINKHEKALNQRNNCANEVLFDIANINKDEAIEMYVRHKKIDDYLNKSNYIENNLDLVKRNKIQFDIKIKDNNFWGVIPQPKTFNIDRTSVKFNVLKTQKDNSNKIIENENNSSKKNNISSIKKNYSLFLSKKSTVFQDKNKKDDNDEILKKNTKYKPILEMPYIELPEDENIKYKENEEIKQIRKKTLELLIEKEEELKKNNKMKNNKTSNQNQIIKGKFCTDSEGKIVMIKEINPESLLKEFWPITSNQKEILSGKSHQTIQKETYLLEQKAKKNIAYSNGMNPIIINNNMFYNKDNIKNNEKKNSKYKINDNINMFKEEMFNIQPPSLGYLSPKSERVEPSGSNFKIINPSVGVNIKEKNQTKTGGINFYETFHKFSINDFNKTLHDTLEWETKTKLKGNYSNNFNKNIIKEEINFQNDKNVNKDKLFRKTFSGGFKNRKNILKSNSDLFKINQKSPILKEILLKDVDININLTKKFGKSLSNENIFDRNIKSPTGRMDNNDRKRFNYEMINEFNKELIMGNYQFNKSKKPFLPKLPPKIKSAYPNLLKNYNNFNKTTNNFYRTRKKKNIIDLLTNFSNPSSANNKKRRIFSPLKDNK